MASNRFERCKRISGGIIVLMNTSVFSALETGAIVCDLGHLGLIEFSGEDTQTFLQGQLTNDIREVVETRSQLAGYCTAKGRLLATLLLWKNADGICAQLHGDIAASVQKRLTMYVLRSRVRVVDVAAQWERLGVAGRASEEMLGHFFGALPQRPMDTIQGNGARLIRMHGAIPRFEVILPPEAAVNLQAALLKICSPADARIWDWLDIRAGVAQIGPGTQEQFVPQMVNLDLLEGINFKKGCYTGQEIVARTHYLGTVKRRMHLVHAQTNELPVPGNPVYGEDSAEPVGMVVNAAPAPGGGFDLLTEVRLESVAVGEIRLASRDGPRLQLLELPYGF